MLAAQRATAGLSYGEICDAQCEAQETVMREFGVKRIVTENRDYTLEEMLPHSFGPESLE